MKRPKAFNMFLDSVDQVKKLSNDQAGLLFKSLLFYANGMDTPDFDDLAVDLMFDMMSKQIDRDFEKYEEACKRRTNAAKVAAAARYNKSANRNDSHAFACDCCQYEDEDENKDENENKDKYEYKNEDEVKNKPLSDDGAVGRASPTIDRDAADVIDHLNKRADTHYRTDSQRTRELISAKLRDNYTVADMKAVIDKKCREWLGTEYEKYLRPDTLFGEHFESYLNTPENPSRPKNKLHPWQSDSQDEYVRQAEEWARRSAERLDSLPLSLP